MVGEASGRAERSLRSTSTGDGGGWRIGFEWHVSSGFGAGGCGVRAHTVLPRSPTLGRVLGMVWVVRSVYGARRELPCKEGNAPEIARGADRNEFAEARNELQPNTMPTASARGLGLSAGVLAQAGLSAGVPAQVNPSGSRLGGESARGLIRLENRDPPKRHA